ncbi:TIR domain-containing protein [Pontiellaceae bacterium B12227]|nr:TIR domain-containing protein [Pontiellaceae bacterium B12227]
MSTQDKKVFISYASENITDSMVLCHLMEQRNIPCWIAPRDIDPGNNYGEAIIEAITHVNAVVVLLTDASNKSKYVAREIERSVSNDKHIIPVVIGSVIPSKKLEFFLSDIQWELVNEASWKKMISKLSSVESPADVKNLQPPADITKIIDAIAAQVTDAPATRSPSFQPPPAVESGTNKKAPMAAIAGIATLAFVILLGPKLFTQTEEPSDQSTEFMQSSLVPLSSADLSKALEHVLELSKKGDSEKAQALIAGLSEQHNDDRMVKAVASYLDSNRKQTSRDHFNKLAEMLEKRKSTQDSQATEGAAPLARPRILACIGPVSQQGGDGDTMAMLYRICIQSELEAGEGLQVVEREAIETVFEEMNLGSSNLADANSRLELGKLLPAGILLLGDIIASPGKDLIYLRLVDTETTRVISTIKGSAVKDEDIGKICSELASQVRQKILTEYPLETLGKTDGTQTIETPVGRFHGASSSTEFNVYADITANELLGTARMKKLGDAESTLEMTKSIPELISEVFLCEQALN